MIKCSYEVITFSKKGSKLISTMSIVLIGTAKRCLRALYRQVSKTIIFNINKSKPRKSEPIGHFDLHFNEKESTVSFMRY